MLAFFRNDMGFGGNNGFTDFKELLGLPVRIENVALKRPSLNDVFLQLTGRDLRE